MDRTTPKATYRDLSDEARPFDPWRYTASDRARSLVRDVVSEARAYDGIIRQMQRAPKAKDLATFVATIESMLCDVVHLALSASPASPRYLMVTRSKDCLSYGPQRYRAPALNRRLPKILDLLHAMGLIEQEIGDRSPFAYVFTEEFGVRRERRRTTIAPGRRLISAIEQYGVTFADLGRHDGGEVIILKEERQDYWHTPGGLDYAETLETERLRWEVQEINRWLAAADLTLVERCPGELHHIDLSDRHLRRIFTGGSFKSGGRLAGGFWMPLERTLRLSRLRISGEPVASLDYSSLNPRLLYAREGVKPPEGDQYAIAGLEAYRPGMKRLLNALLFDVRPRDKKPRRTPDELHEGVELFPPHMTIGELINALEDAHRPIAHYFGTGVGHELQRTESTILVKALLELKGEGIVGLPVHDCVVVGRSKVDMARRIMEAVSREVAGMPIPVTVEVVED